MSKLWKYLVGAAALIATATATMAPAQSQEFRRGLGNAGKNAAVNELVAAAKRADPDSPLPGIIEHLLAGLSMVNYKDPTPILEGVFPSSIAANAIGQLLDRHGKDIARMSYRSSSIDLYGDPRKLPQSPRARNYRAALELCYDLMPTQEVGSCSRLVPRLRGCATSQKMSAQRFRACNEDLDEFYTMMEFYGRTPQVRQAGALARAEFGRISLSPIPQPKAPSAEFARTNTGFVLIQVDNHPNRALAIKSAASIEAHFAGKSRFRLCNFLHGGLCGGRTVVTPNGNRVTAGQSPIAQIAKLRTFNDYASARAGMCALVANVRPNRLSAGFSGDYRGRRVTIDVRSVGNPC
ncbi:MAG: hypothetical protein AAF127_09070 [Pseudomonadota bacterium]